MTSGELIVSVSSSSSFATGLVYHAAPDGHIGTAQVSEAPVGPPSDQRGRGTSLGKR